MLNITFSFTLFILFLIFFDTVTFTIFEKSIFDTISNILYHFKHHNKKYETSLQTAYQELKRTHKELINKKMKKSKRDIEEIEKSMALISKILTYEGKVNKDEIINDLADIIGSYHSK